MHIIDCTQGSDEWFAVRMGKMTASHAQAIATCGKGLETYCQQLAAEIFTGKRPESYKNENMQRGNDEECFARMAYELDTDNRVDIVGFAQHSDSVGCSPDGRVGLKGGVEIKRKTFIKHLNLLLGVEEFESSYVWQCHMNMLVFNAEWWDLMSFNPDFKDRSLYRIRIYRDSKKDESLLKGFDLGEDLIKKYLNILNNQDDFQDRKTGR